MNRVFYITTKKKIVFTFVLLPLFLFTSCFLEAKGFSRNSNNFSSPNPDYTLLGEIDALIKNSFIDGAVSSELMEGAISGMLESLDDPYSSFIPLTDLEQIADTTQGHYGGVGLSITKEPYDAENPNGRKPYVVVVSPMEGGPAYKEGIRSRDYIYAIEGNSTKDLSADDISNLLRGDPGSKVNITFLRGEKRFTVTIKRDIIEVPVGHYSMVDNKTGYIRLIQFTPFAADRIREAVNFFEKEDYKNLILDLRNNPGGLLGSAVEVSNLFLKEGTIVSTRYRQSRKNQTYRAKPNAQVVSEDINLYVLINGGSASASEIVTGALKDNNRAKIIGEKSFGKGAIQEVMSLEGYGLIKLTTGRYYSPLGNSIDKVGIEPHDKVSYPKRTDKDFDDEITLLKNSSVEIFLERKGLNPSQKDIDAFIATLRKEGITLDQWWIERLIAYEANIQKREPADFILKYDPVLQHTLKLIK